MGGVGLGLRLVWVSVDRDLLTRSSIPPACCGQVHRTPSSHAPLDEATLPESELKSLALL